MNQRAAQAMLKRCKVTPRIANNGQEAVDAVRETGGGFGIIFMGALWCLCAVCRWRFAAACGAVRDLWVAAQMNSPETEATSRLSDDCSFLPKTYKCPSWMVSRRRASSENTRRRRG